MPCRPNQHRLSLLVLCLLVIPLTSAAVAETGPLPVILDTDMTGDCDDAGALGLLNALADKSEAEILAVAINREELNRASAAAADAINTHYGRPDIPIGTYKGGGTAFKSRSPYTEALRDEFAHDTPPDDQCPDALDVYRRTLAEQPDNSVTIVSVGALSNLADLLRSDPDDHSGLSGSELIRRKVKRLVVMGGSYPKSKRPETNFKLHPEAAAHVAEHWPGDVYFQGFKVGRGIITGPRLQLTPTDNPARRAYELRPYKGKPALQVGKPSHDQAAVLFAVRGPQNLWDVHAKGGNTVDPETGHTRWEKTATRPGHHRILRKGSGERFEPIIGRLMARKPDAVPTTPVIFDTDIQGDVDDVGATALLHTLADRGEAKILAMAVSSKHPDSPACLDALNTFYGRPDIPIGVNKGEGFRRDSRYASQIAKRYPQDLGPAASAPDAVDVYRRTLAAQPDGSVVIITIGQLSNLAALLRSKPDAHSDLPGPALVEKKIKAWVCMGGKFPKGREANLVNHGPAAKHAIDHWPTRIVFSGFEVGREIRTGGRTDTLPDGHPLRLAYRLFNGNTPRQSWDQTAVLYAVRHLGDAGGRLWNLNTQGHCHIRPDGRNEWRDMPDRPHAHLVPEMKPGRIAELIEDLMLSHPGPPDG